MRKHELRNRVVKSIQKKHNVDLETMLAIKNIVNDYVILDKKYKSIPKVCTCGQKHSQTDININECANCRGIIQIEIEITRK